MYTVGLETDTRAYFSGVTILISLPSISFLADNMLCGYIIDIGFLKVTSLRSSVQSLMSCSWTVRRFLVLAWNKMSVD